MCAHRTNRDVDIVRRRQCRSCGDTHVTWWEPWIVVQPVDFITGKAIEQAIRDHGTRTC